VTVGFFETTTATTSLIYCKTTEPTNKHQKTTKKAANAPKKDHPTIPKHQTTTKNG
jgi:hypothetical protein